MNSQHSPSSKPIVFFHLPKTAGTSFHEVLSEIYPAEKSFSVTGFDPLKKLEELKELSASEKADIELLKGHLLLKGDEILAKPCIYLVFFRDPIERTISEYHYIKKASHNRFHDSVKKIRLRDFPDFLLENDWDNLQTRFLSTPSEQIRFPAYREDLSELEKHGLDRALAVLHQKIDHPLITEEFDRALVYLTRKLDWSHCPIPEVKNASRSKRTEKLGKKTLRELEKVNELDLELYEKAKNLFYRNLEQVWDERMERELERVQGNKKVPPEPEGFLERLKRKLWS